ncbi:MAG: hypothetical protein LBD10_07505 [Desulfobulbus sp.]|jgi:hypothetical protein|uniref:hypothetical protein n=1 Tax=Desulfobulbus sp. TaxID=895 RepID=UPI0028422F5A|nr:hypothetical protein [Desulfobulbus sp.]MDR2550024.1 hypothetical protein [Desulfobulbus sp.]
MGLVATASGTLAATVGTEHSLTQQTGIGIYVLMVDTAAMAEGDTVEFRLKTRRASGETSRTAYKYTHSDAQDEPHKYSDAIPVDTEIICTLTQTVGTGRTFPWKLLRA